MEEKDKDEVEQTPENQEENQQEETGTENDESKETAEATPEEIDYNVAPEEKEEEKPSRSELDKAKFTAKSILKRIEDLGGDPSEVASDFVKGEKEKKEVAETPDIEATVKTSIIREFAEREARAISSSEKEYIAIMSWVRKGLSVEDAHILANKGRVKTVISEIKRASEAKPGNSSGAGQKTNTARVPARPNEEVNILESRGLKFNPKTQTYQGKFTEEYYDFQEKKWKSRRISR